MSAPALTPLSSQVAQYKVPTSLITAEPDRSEAERFLTSLDEAAEKFTFQTFDDNKASRDQSLARVLHGSLDEHFEELARLNQAGAGVFVTVNETDLKGRKKENIIGVRAVFQEADHSDVPMLPIEPHIVVESSPGKYHRYILVEGAPLDGFEGVQQRLVDDYGSDPNAKDISRVLRLPGFYHKKNPAEPHTVRIVQESAQPPLAWAAVKEKLPPVERTVRTSDGLLPEPGTPLRNPAEIMSALEALSPDLPYQDWLTVGMALHSTGAGLEAFSLWDRWSQVGTSYRSGECAYRWGTFSQEGGITLGTLFHMAHKAGWDSQISTRPDILALVEEQGRRMLEDFGRHHAVVMVEGKAVVAYRERDENTGRMTTRFSTPGDLKLKHQPDKLPTLKTVKGGGQTVEYKPLVDTWLNSPMRRTYDQLVFKPVPGLVAGDTALPDGKVLNLYQGLTIEPKPGDCQPILDHIREVWCSGDQTAYDYVLRWLARMLQKPQERGHTVIVLRSGEGTGKNIIVDILVRAFGEHATVAVKPDDLTGRFNDHLATSVLVHPNEAVWGGNKEHEGALKSLITDEELPVERKYLPKYRVTNCCHLIMASNNDWVAPVGLDDRRFVILDLNEARKGDAAYFKMLAEHIKNGGAEAFLDHLLKLDIKDFDPRQLPDLGLNQATKRDAKVRGLDSVSQWWVHCLEEGAIWEPTVSNHFDDLAPGWDNGPIRVQTHSLYQAYAAWAVRLHRRAEHSSSVGKKLKELARIETARPSASTNPYRKRAYDIPKLSECRRQWETKVRQKWDWGDDDEEYVVEKPCTGIRQPRRPPPKQALEDAVDDDDSECWSKVPPNEAALTTGCKAPGAKIPAL